MNYPSTLTTDYCLLTPILLIQLHNHINQIDCPTGNKSSKKETLALRSSKIKEGIPLGIPLRKGGLNEKLSSFITR